MALVGRRVELVELHRRLSEGLLEIAGATFRRSLLFGTVRVLRKGRSLQRLFEIEPSFRRRVFDAYQSGCRRRLLEGLRHDHRDRLMVVVDFGTAEQLRRVEFALAELAGVLSSHDGDDPGRALRLRQIHAPDAAFADRGPQDGPVGRIGHNVVVLVGVCRLSRGLQGAVDAVMCASHDPHAVDGVGFGGFIELHCCLASCMAAATVRSTSDTLNAFSLVGFASASRRVENGFAPPRSSASAFSIRQGLGATPPTATRPVPSRCSTAATETRAKA